MSFPFILSSMHHIQGMVPRNYLDCQQEGSAKAKFDFEAKTSVELELKKGDTLRLIRKVDDNWYEGVNARNQIGIFPCSYVETIKQPICKNRDDDVRIFDEPNFLYCFTKQTFN